MVQASLAVIGARRPGGPGRRRPGTSGAEKTKSKNERIKMRIENGVAESILYGQVRLAIAMGYGEVLI